MTEATPIGSVVVARGVRARRAPSVLPGHSPSPTKTASLSRPSDRPDSSAHDRAPCSHPSLPFLLFDQPGLPLLASPGQLSPHPFNIPPSSLLSSSSLSSLLPLLFPPPSLFNTSFLSSLYLSFNSSFELFVFRVCGHTPFAPLVRLWLDLHPKE
ncbi:uncharacterized protein BDW70DRAFT_160516 [Aspergillus foveolatus]|uniref:uncharacterized protein n=1 Tax=Aspergillus foveolatus TaxID=210207 RepID=UPI003CCC9931